MTSLFEPPSEVHVVLCPDCSMSHNKWNKLYQLKLIIDKNRAQLIHFQLRNANHCWCNPESLLVRAYSCFRGKLKHFSNTLKAPKPAIYRLSKPLSSHLNYKYTVSEQYRIPLFPQQAGYIRSVMIIVSIPENNQTNN